MPPKKKYHLSCRGELPIQKNSTHPVVGPMGTQQSHCIRDPRTPTLVLLCTGIRGFKISFKL